MYGMLICRWWLRLQSVVSGIVFPVGWILQWIVMNQWNDDTKILYWIVRYVIGLPCCTACTVPILHSHRKLSNNAFTCSPCLCTAHDCWLCCSQNANCAACSAVQCGLCCALYGRETWCVVLQGKHGLRCVSRGQREVFGSKEIEVTGN